MAAPLRALPRHVVTLAPAPGLALVRVPVTTATVRCSECRGAGLDPWEGRTCPLCHGATTLTIRTAPLGDQWAAMLADENGLYSAGSLLGVAPSEADALRGPGWWLVSEPADPWNPRHDFILDVLAVEL